MKLLVVSFQYSLEILFLIESPGVSQESQFRLHLLKAELARLHVENGGLSPKPFSRRSIEGICPQTPARASNSRRSIQLVVPGS